MPLCRFQLTAVSLLLLVLLTGTVTGPSFRLPTPPHPDLPYLLLSLMVLFTSSESLGTLDNVFGTSCEIGSTKARAVAIMSSTEAYGILPRDRLADIAPGSLSWPIAATYHDRCPRIATDEQRGGSHRGRLSSRGLRRQKHAPVRRWPLQDDDNLLRTSRGCSRGVYLRPNVKSLRILCCLSNG